MPESIRPLRVDRLRGAAPRSESIDNQRESFSVTDPELKRWYPDRATLTVKEQSPKRDERYDATDAERAASSSELLSMPAGSAWPDDLPKKMLAELESGHYHVGTILESFAVKWPREKCARDVWQNFFDANGYSLNGIVPTITEEGGVFTIRIEGNAIYDPRKLLHIGGTSKQFDTRAAGGFGEGTAVSSFVLLRDYAVDAIQFESVGWKLDFELKTAQRGTTTEQERGLFATLAHNDQREEGNAITIVTRDAKMVETLRDAKELFYYEGHPDFKDPLFENDFGGIKLLPRGEGYGEPKGHLYDAGQRRHYENITQWDNLEWMHFWTKHKSLPSDRDRGKATRQEVTEHMIQPFVESLDFAAAEALVYKLEPMWDEGSYYYPVVELLDRLCKKLKAANRTLIFPEKCVATNMMNFRITQIMKQSGHRLCHGALAEVGMKTQSTRWHELQNHFRIEAQPEQARRIEILQHAARLLEKTAKEIWLFESSSMNGVLRGQYGGEQHVWLTDAEVQSQPFHEALATYLHELDHQYGNDGSAEFTDALTKTLGAVMKNQIDHPDEWRALAAQWTAGSDQNN